MTTKPFSAVLGVAFALAATAPLSSAAQLDRAVVEYVEAEYGLTDFDVVELELPRGLPGTLDLRIESQVATAWISLEHVSVRAPGFRLRAEIAPGEIVELPAPPPTTYRGNVVGDPHGRVAASLVPAGLRAAIHHDFARTWMVQPIPELGAGMHLVYRKHTPDLPGDACEALPPPAPEQPVTAGGSFSGSSGCLSSVRIAYDVDHEYYQFAGADTTSVMNDVDAGVNGMIAIYAHDLGITYELTDVLIRTDPSDPYESPLPNVRLGEFAQEWNTNQQAVPRDVAHLLVGFDMDTNVIGIAFVGVVCNTGAAYGLTQFISNNFQSRINVMTHEVGHNWSAPHCLDPSCVVMCGACPEFGPITSQQILDYRNQVSCPTGAAGLSTGMSPRPIEDVVFTSASSVTIDVLENDVDANCDTLTITGFDGTTSAGGSVSLSVGTGPGGRDELVYTAPANLPAEDFFDYTVSDGSSSRSAEVSIYPKLLAHWAFDDCNGNTAEDLSRSGLDALYSNGPTLCESPSSFASGQAVAFDMTQSEHASFTAGEPLKLLRHDFTVAAWINPVQNSTLQRVLSNTGAWTLGLAGASPRLTLLGLTNLDFAGVVGFDTWTHLAFTFDDEFVVRAFVNGVSLGSYNLPLSTQEPSDDWFIASFDGTQDFFGGRIDDLQVYGCALAPSEIAALNLNPGLTLIDLEDTGVPFCFGDGGDQLGCTDCPCGNNAPPGTPGGCLNGVAASAVLSASGAPRVVLDTLRFTMTGGNPSTFAVLTSGDAAAPANPASPCIGTSSGIVAAQLDGLRCAVQNVQRHGSRAMDLGGSVGLVNNGWGPPDGPDGGLLAQGGFQAGQTRYFQVIYREDDTLSCMRGQNTSNGVEVLVLP